MPTTTERVTRKACDRCHTQKLSCKRARNQPPVRAGGGEAACERCVRLKAECNYSPSLRYKKQQHQGQTTSGTPSAPGPGLDRQQANKTGFDRLGGDASDFTVRQDQSQNDTQSLSQLQPGHSSSFTTKDISPETKRMDIDPSLVQPEAGPIVPSTNELTESHQRGVTPDSLLELRAFDLGYGQVGFFPPVLQHQQQHQHHDQPGPGMPQVDYLSHQGYPPFEEPNFASTHQFARREDHQHLSPLQSRSQSVGEISWATHHPDQSHLHSQYSHQHHPQHLHHHHLPAQSVDATPRTVTPPPFSNQDTSSQAQQHPFVPPTTTSAPTPSSNSLNRSSCAPTHNSSGSGSGIGSSNRNAINAPATTSAATASRQGKISRLRAKTRTRQITLRKAAITAAAATVSSDGEGEASSQHRTSTSPDRSNNWKIPGTAESFNFDWMARLSELQTRLVDLAALLPRDGLGWNLPPRPLAPTSDPSTIDSITRKNSDDNSVRRTFSIEEMFRLTREVADVLDYISQQHGTTLTGTATTDTTSKDQGVRSSPKKAQPIYRHLDSDPGSSMFILSIYIRLLDMYQKVFTLVRSELSHADTSNDLNIAAVFKTWKLPDVTVGSFAVDSTPVLQISLTMQLAEEFLSRLRCATAALQIADVTGSKSQELRWDQQQGNSLIEIVGVSFQALRTREEGLRRHLGELRGEIEALLDS